VSTNIQERVVSESWDPVPDRAAAEALGAALARVGYTEESVEELLGEDGTAAGPEDIAVFSRRLPGTPLGTALRLLLLQLPVEETEGAVALGQDAVDALLALGLVVAGDGKLVPRSRIMPVENLLLSFDGFSTGDDPHGYVSTFSPTTAWLTALTPRRRVASAVDIGTGNGAHALLVARHSDRVIATDLNARALAYTEINAALNGFEQHRDQARQPVRAGGGRAVRPDHLQRAVRRLSGVEVAVPRLRHARRPAVRTARPAGCRSARR